THQVVVLQIHHHILSGRVIHQEPQLVGNDIHTRLGILCLTNGGAHARRTNHHRNGNPPFSIFDGSCSSLWIGIVVAVAVIHRDVHHVHTGSIDRRTKAV